MGKPELLLKSPDEQNKAYLACGALLTVTISWNSNHDG
jgi:hypothetical protein